MNFALAIDPERVLAMRERREVKPERERDHAQRVDGGAMFKPGKLRETVLAVLRGNSLSLSELHAKIGGSKGSLSVILVNLKAAGLVQISGEKMHYRYGAPA